MPQATGKRASRKVLDACRLAYETTRTSFTKLAKLHGIARGVLLAVSAAEKWKKHEPVLAARAIETAVLVEGLQSAPPTDPSLPPAPRRGRPRKYLRLNDAAELTHEQRRMIAAREEYEAGGHLLPDLAKKYGFSAGKLRYAAQVEGWKLRPGATTAPPVPPPVEIPADQPPEPVSAPEAGAKKPTSWAKVAASADVKSADVINFPGIAKPETKKAVAVQLLPEQSPAEKAELRRTLAVIRAMMSVEQVQQLERHEALLLRYSHLLEVYLEPHRFVDTSGLDPDDAAERVVAAQRVALRMLLPTDRDTLSGAIKTLTDALGRTIALKRGVAGLDKVSAGVMRPGGLDIDGELGDKAQVTDIDLETGELRAVQRAMEMLDRQHRRSSEPPKPPPPDSIDDLLGPAAEVAKDPEGDDPASGR